MADEKKRPDFEYRLSQIRVSVWRNKSESGTFYSTQIARRYRDGDDWKYTHSFNGLADLALVEQANRLAQEFIKASTINDDPATAGDD